jgi:predicted DNA-binding transcriptional regulator AlpA
MNQDGEFEKLLRKVLQEEFGKFSRNNKDSIDNEFIDIKEVAKRINYSEAAVRKMVTNKTIPFHKIPQQKDDYQNGFKVLFIWSEVLNWITTQNGKY